MVHLNGKDLDLNNNLSPYNQESCPCANFSPYHVSIHRVVRNNFAINMKKIETYV